MKILLFDKQAMGEDMDLSGLDRLGEVIDCGLRKTEEDVLSAIDQEECRDAPLLLTNKAPVTARVMDALPDLRYIGVFATGYNNIDIPAAVERGITVCNVPGYSTEAVAQLVFSLILQIAGQTHKYTLDTKAGKWIESPVFSMITHRMEELNGKTLGILGYGNIGSRVAEIGNAFGMKILVCRKNRSEPCPYPYVDEDTLLKSADYLSLNCPLTKETERFICKESIARMKDGAVLINTARGGMVDEEALAEALKSGKLKAAGLDVLAKEPMAADCPLAGLENCYITPHIGWAPAETRARLLDTVIANIEGFLRGEPQNTVG